MIEINNLPNCPGIYCIKNLVNEKCYIGQSIKIKKRLYQHIKSVNKVDVALYRAINKYGLENFEVSVLETVQTKTSLNELKSILDDLEKKYIQEYNSYNNGYNSTLGGDYGVLGLKMTDEQKQKISHNSTAHALDGRNKIYVYSIKTKCTYTFITAEKAADYFGISGDQVRSSKSHRRLFRGEFIFYRTDEEKEESLQKIHNIRTVSHSSNKTGSHFSKVDYDQYYQFLISHKDLNQKQISELLEITVEAVKKRNQKLRELGYNLPTTRIKEVIVYDTIDNTHYTTTVKELSEKFGITDKSMRRVLHQNNLYKKRYKFDIINI